MAKIYQAPTQIPGTVGVFPNQKFCIFGDNLATVTTAGYLNQIDLTPSPVSSTDVILAFYDYDLNTESGTYGTFTVGISNLGVITLTSVGVAGSGIVNTATINSLAYYAASGDTVSGL